jgi:hypothetical protein
VITAFERLSDAEKARLRLILNRFGQAKRRNQIEDKILDLGIALEMLLLKDNANHEQLALSFRLRGAWLVASSAEERVVAYGKLRDIYKYRSQVAHSGVLCRGNSEQVNKVREVIPEYQSLAGRICPVRPTTPTSGVG